MVISLLYIKRSQVGILIPHLHCIKLIEKQCWSKYPTPYYLLRDDPNTRKNRLLFRSCPELWSIYLLNYYWPFEVKIPTEYLPLVNNFMSFHHCFTDWSSWCLVNLSCYHWLTDWSSRWGSSWTERRSPDWSHWSDRVCHWAKTSRIWRRLLQADHSKRICL